MGKGTSTKVNRGIQRVAKGQLPSETGSSLGLGKLGGDTAAALGIDGNPFANAAAEDDQRFADAIEEAKKLEKKSTTTTDQTSTSQTVFDPKSKQESALMNQSIANFNKQGALADSFESDLGQLGALESQGRDVLSGIAGGGAFDLTAGEQSRINNLRDSGLAATGGAINQLLDSRLAELEADNARRGLRGQAVSQLQQGTLADAANTMAQQGLEANRIAAQQAIDMPAQRVGLQAGVGSNLATMQQQAQQQAIANRQALQDPVALAQMRDERLKGGKTSATNTGTQSTTSTGDGVAELMAQRAGLPGQKASKVAGGMGILELGVKGAGAIMGGG